MFMVKHNGESVDAWLIKFLFGLSLVSTVHVLLLLFIFQAAQTVSHALSSTDNSEYIGKVWWVVLQLLKDTTLILASHARFIHNIIIKNIWDLVLLPLDCIVLKFCINLLFLVINFQGLNIRDWQMIWANTRLGESSTKFGDNFHKVYLQTMSDEFLTWCVGFAALGLGYGWLLE